MKIEYTIMESNYENALYVEQMRYKSYGVKDTKKINAEYLEDIVNGDILVFLCFIDSIPVSACYISCYKKELLVEYLFTLQEYQRKQLYYGKQLLQYILDNKQLVEEYFNCKFNKSVLYPANNKLINLYESLGYQVTNLTDIQMTKQL